MRDIYHDTYHMQFNNIYFRFHPKVVILDHYSSCIEVSTSNDIVSVIVVENINHLSINSFILVVLRKHQFIHFHIIVKIKYIHHYLILTGFYNNLGIYSLGTVYLLIIVAVPLLSSITPETKIYCCINQHILCHYIFCCCYIIVYFVSWLPRILHYYPMYFLAQFYYLGHLELHVSISIHDIFL